MEENPSKLNFAEINMTKYILHGGASKHEHVGNNKFFAEMTKNSKGKLKILLNYFSREDGEITELSKKDERRIRKNSKNKNLEFQIANIESLEKQLERMDVMYMRGGETEKLVRVMSKVDNLEKYFENKIIAGSSAGVYVLAKYY